MLVTSRQDQMFSIWIAPNGDSSRAKPISSGKYDGTGGLDWTPDGRIVYSTTGNSRGELWIMQPDGSERKQLGGDGTLPRVSSNGRYVVFEPMPWLGTGIWRMELESGDLKHLTGNSFSYSLSHGGQWVVYMSDVSGSSTIWKVPVEGGEPMLLVNREAYYQAISPDGKLLAYTYPEEDSQSIRLKTAVMPVEGGKAIKILPSQGRFMYLWMPDWPAITLYKWAPNGRALTYSNTVGGVSNIWNLPIDGGKPKQLTDFKSEKIYDFAWSRDGKNLALVRVVNSNDVVLISDFR